MQHNQQVSIQPLRVTPMLQPHQCLSGKFGKNINYLQVPRPSSAIESNSSLESVSPGINVATASLSIESSSSFECQSNIVSQVASESYSSLKSKSCISSAVTSAIYSYN